MTVIKSMTEPVFLSKLWKSASFSNAINGSDGVCGGACFHLHAVVVCV